MRDRRLQIQVGLLFLLSVTLLVLGILWFKEFKIGGETYRVVVEFPNTSGLQEGDPVEVKGVPSGKVADIRFEEGQALVELQLDRGVILYGDARIAIENLGLMGQKAVSIYPGTIRGGRVGPDTLLRGEYRAGLPELMGGAESSLDTFSRLASRIDTLLAGFDVTKRERIDRTMVHMEQATGDLAQILRENRQEISATLQSTSRAMADLHALLEGRDEQFGRALEGASGATAHLDSTLTQLDATVRRMDAILTRVENGEGTLGKAIDDEALYHEMVATLTDAKALLKDVRENPKRYFKFSIF